MKKHITDGTPCWCNPRIEKVSADVVQEYPKEEIFEKLSAIEHERWADWQKYIHSKCLTDTSPEGTQYMKFPYKLFKRWEKQIATPYEKLSEKEKDSDRDQVMRYWALLVDERRGAYERAIKNYGQPQK